MISIVEKFEKNPHKLALDAILEARANKGKINKELLSIVENYYLNIKEYQDKEMPISVIYAIFLLAEFKEKKLYPLLIKLLKNNALDDCILDELHRIIISIFDGNFDILNALIEDKNIDSYIRERLLQCYIYFYENKIVNKNTLELYLHKLIILYNYEDEDIYNTIMEVIINTHLFSFIEDVKVMCAEGVIDYMIRGGYDSFIDDIFNYDDNLDKFSPIIDTVKEMSWWYCFTENQKEEVDYEKIEDNLNKKILNDIEEIDENPFSKVGRNDPCPCGSGKKYKKCCIDKTDTFLPYQKYIDDSLKKYPQRKNRKDILDIYDFYKEEYVEIDKLLYKALKHKAIPLFIKRNYNTENKINLAFLDDAFEKIKEVVEHENFSNIDVYDKVVSIHYGLYLFFDQYSDLLETLIKNDIGNHKDTYVRKLKELITFFYQHFDLNNSHESIFLNGIKSLYFYEKRFDEGIEYFKSRINNCLEENKYDVYENLFDLILCKNNDFKEIDKLINKEKDLVLKKELKDLKKDLIEFNATYDYEF